MGWETVQRVLTRKNGPKMFMSIAGVHNLDESRGHIKFSKVIAGRIEIVIKHAAAGQIFFGGGGKK